MKNYRNVNQGSEELLFSYSLHAQSFEAEGSEEDSVSFHRDFVTSFKHLQKKIFFVFLLMLLGYSAFANNISVTSVSLTGQDITNDFTIVQFTISWEKSWRTSADPVNWDAAWVFVKYRVTATYGGDGLWKHASLNNTGHTNPAGSTITTGLLIPASTFDPTTNPGLGAFIYRDANSLAGTFTSSGVQLRWNYGVNKKNSTDFIGDNDQVDIQVFAIEMVYVPQGSFYAGSGSSVTYETGFFYKHPTSTNPYQITGEGPITVGTETNNLYYDYGSSLIGDQAGPIPDNFPKGFTTFYCMKYEIMQQQYVDFLNSLTQAQASTRKYTGASYRYTITGSTAGSYSTTNPYVACNFLSWPDLAAYLDWSGLRPMTELEFEKSCRGTQTAVPNEYAWGTTGIASGAYTLSNSGATNEAIATNYSMFGNVSYITTIGSINGPLRVGIFASNSSNTGRVTSGATYYGIMEMSGNLWERPVTAGNIAGRSYTGLHGDGTLNTSGDATVDYWPGINGNTNIYAQNTVYGGTTGVTQAAGSGFRGGFWENSEHELRVSDRINAASSGVLRSSNYGGRGVRTAP